MKPEEQNNLQPTNTSNSAGDSQDYGVSSMNGSPIASTNNEQASQQLAQSATSNKKSTRLIIEIVSICAVLACIVGVAIVALMSITNNSSNQPSGTSQEEGEAPEEEQEIAETPEKPATTPEGLPDCSQVQDQAEIAVCNTMAGAAQYLADKYSPTDGQIVLDYKYYDYGPLYRPDYLLTETSLTPNGKTYLMSYNIKGLDYTVIEDYLLGKGFSRASNWRNVGGQGDNFSYINGENGTICAYAPRDLVCSNISFYPLEGSEDANLINELATVLEANGMSRPISFSVNDIEDSEISPYQTIGKYLSFYRTSPNSEWILGYYTQAVMFCHEFKNDDMRKAYASITCQIDEAGGLTTVKEYYSL